MLLVSPHIEGSPELGDVFRSFVRWTAGSAESEPGDQKTPAPGVAGGVSGPNSGLESSQEGQKPKEAEAKSGQEGQKPTEAEIVQIFQKFDLNKDGLLDAAELEGLLGSLGGEADPGLGELVAKMRLQESRGIPYEELVAWVFGAPCSFDRPDVETDGEEDAVMDKMSMIPGCSGEQFSEFSDEFR